jgi:hypothetical protein
MSELYQKKYEALGVEVNIKPGKTGGVGYIRPRKHMIKNVSL